MDDWQNMTNTMQACLTAAQTQFDALLIEPTSEDIRAVGISMFIEARRSGLTLPAAVRFRTRAEALQNEVGHDAFTRVLEQHSTPDLISVTDSEIMRSIILALEAAKEV